MASQGPPQNVSRKVVKGNKNKFIDASELPEYDKQRLKRLKSNVDFMEAMGYGNMAAKILQQKYEHVGRSILESEIMSDDDYGDDDDDDDGEYHLAQDEESYDQICEKGYKDSKFKKTKSRKTYVSEQDEDGIGKKDICSKKLKQAEAQSLSMADRRKLRSQRKGTHQQSIHEQPLKDNVDDNVTNEQVRKFKATKVCHDVASSEKQKQSLDKDEIGEKDTCFEKLKQTEAQSLTMADRRILRSQMKVNHQQSTEEQPLENNADNMVTYEQLSEFITTKACLDKVDSVKQKKRLNCVKMPEKTFCPPGSISAFARLRQQQLSKHIEPGSGGHITTLASTKGLKSVAGQGLTTSASSEAVVVNQVEDNAMQVAYEANQLEGDAMGTGNDEELQIEPAPQGEIEKKKRGPTLMAHVHARRPEERPVIILNKHGQPVGPTDAILKEFSSFLGTLARDSKLVPLKYDNWQALPEGTTERIWDSVLGSYVVPEEGKNWVSKTLNLAWHTHKCRTKKKTLQEVYY